MTDFEMWSLLVGFLLPPMVAVIQQKSWSDSVRAMVTFACCIVAALGICYFSAMLDGKGIISAVLTILVTAVATYKAFWHKIGISDVIEKLTSRKTS